jgi:monoterpene epsilon-lactone hydrolase
VLPLPPILIQVGGEEVLLDDLRRYAVEARKAGAPITIELWQAMHHVFQLDVKTLASSRQALDRAAAFLRSGR